MVHGGENLLDKSIRQEQEREALARETAEQQEKQQELARQVLLLHPREGKEALRG